jgi:hypothetical protein
MHLTKALAVSALVVAVVISAAKAQETLPPGPGMEETAKACGNCHSIGMFRNLHRSAAAWEITINNMIGYGMGGFDYDTVLDYLTTYMGTNPPPAAPPR